MLLIINNNAGLRYFSQIVLFIQKTGYFNLKVALFVEKRKNKFAYEYKKNKFVFII
jgi:hypothetical protein